MSVLTPNTTKAAKTNSNDLFNEVSLQLDAERKKVGDDWYVLLLVKCVMIRARATLILLSIARSRTRLKTYQESYQIDRNLLCYGLAPNLLICITIAAATFNGK